MSEPFLSVIIPSYNELKNLQRGVLNDVATFLQEQTFTWEVILSDDGSTDSTAEQLDTFASKHPGFQVLHNPHAGKGPTVQSGMLAAKGTWCLFTDFDQSTPLSEVLALLQVAESGFDVVIGSREGSGAKRQDEPWYRHLMGRGFNLAVQFLAVPGIHDTQCGFKLFSAKATQLFSKLKVYGRSKTRTDAFTGALDVEILFLARKNGFKICEHPIIWTHHETDRVSPVKDSLRMLFDIVKIRLISLFGGYRT